MNPKLFQKITIQAYKPSKIIIFMQIHFTKHAFERMKQRGISKEEVLLAINNPEIMIKKHGKHYYRKILIRGNIEIVCDKRENNIKIITLYWI